jgi:peptidoglycan/xylan/chitin deacetylase (PgdA/CDA1 family)
MSRRMNDAFARHIRGVKAAIIAFVFAALIGTQARACEPGAIGTSRVFKVATKDRVGIGHGYPALGLAHGEIILTFDDGPMPDTTPAILDILAKDCVKATFFMIGKRAEAHPEIAAKVREAGHTIGSHSYTHRELNKLPAQEADDDIQHGYEAVEKAAFGDNADRPRLVRFPGFKSTPELVAFVHDHHGTVVNTNLSPADWRGQPAAVTFDRLKALFDHMDRGIVILHDSQKETVKLLPMVIAEMKARKMRVVQLVAE